MGHVTQAFHFFAPFPKEGFHLFALRLELVLVGAVSTIEDLAYEGIGSTDKLVRFLGSSGIRSNTGATWLGNVILAPNNNSESNEPVPIILTV